MMLKKIAIDNYRCFHEFRLEFGGRHSLLLLGKNGAGKSAIMDVLALLRKIARGEAKTENLLSRDSQNIWTAKNSMGFCLEAELASGIYSYELEVDLPQGFNAYRVLREKVSGNGQALLERELGSVRIGSSQFGLDWHMLALPTLFETEATTPIIFFRNWLGGMFLLRPQPRNMIDACNSQPDYLDSDCANFPGYLMARLGSEYSLFEELRGYVQGRIPDFVALKAQKWGMYGNRLVASFKNAAGDIPFSQLSDGEKIFILQAMLLALSRNGQDMFVFWDEPDNYIALGEAQSYMRELRGAFANKGQVIVTSHSQAAALAFSRDSALALVRNNHGESPRAIPVPDDMDYVEFLETLDGGGQNEQAQAMSVDFCRG